MKQEERRRQTRSLLLRTTKELIGEKGCNAVTMKDIMERSGLSKGAIFHYVKSKDELFAWVLEEQLEETNERFRAEAGAERPTFEGPMRRISEGLAEVEEPGSATNKALLYLLGKEDQPAVAAALERFYGKSVTLSRQWIESGQRAGVIPETVDAGQTAEMFALLALGMRVRSTLPRDPAAFSAEHFNALMIRILQSR